MTLSLSLLPSFGTSISAWQCKSDPVLTQNVWHTHVNILMILAPLALSCPIHTPMRPPQADIAMSAVKRRITSNKQTNKTNLLFFDSLTCRRLFHREIPPHAPKPKRQYRPRRAVSTPLCALPRRPLTLCMMDAARMSTLYCYRLCCFCASALYKRLCEAGSSHSFF